MTIPKPDLDRLQAKAEACKAESPAPWCLDDRGFGNTVYDRSGGVVVARGLREDMEHIAAFDPPTALALIEMAREGERLREQFETVCRVGFNHCAKDAPVFDKIEAVTGLDLRKYGWSVGQ